MKTNATGHSFRRLGTVLVASVFLCVGYAEDTPKKINKTEGMNAVTNKVPPDYPAIAKQLKIEGPVELEALVTESGTVEKVNIVSGNPVLTRPAAEALKKWKFAPFTSEGKAVKALVPISLSFHM
ncbi:MAG TPA: energy transducer TonB [Candidatus Solibacter sp.]|jgi:TonB family protein